MTTIIGAAGRDRYASVTMLESSRPAPLLELLKSQQMIEAWIRNAGRSPLDVLEIGKHVLQFAEREEEAFRSLLPLMDHAVKAVLKAEHEQLEEDLHLLEWLLTHTPESPDVQALAGSLTRRMIEHLERDGRLLARAANLTPGE